MIIQIISKKSNYKFKDYFIVFIFAFGLSILFLIGAKVFSAIIFIYLFVQFFVDSNKIEVKNDR